MKRVLGNTVLLLCSLGVVFGLVELVTRLTWKEHTHGLYQVLPDQMHLTSNTEGVYKTSEFEFKVTSNRYGRRDWEWTESVMNDPCNVIFIGDSFVLGYGVNEADTIPTLLEKQPDEHGRKTEVFNFGLGGSFPEYLMLTREAIEMGIKGKTIVIGIFLGNDFAGTPVYTRARPATSTPRARLRAPTLSDSAFYRFLKVRVSSSAFFTGLLFKGGKLLGRDIYPTSAGYIFLRGWTKDQEALFYSNLNQSIDIAKVASENRRNVVFVIFPNRVQVENAADLTSSVYDASLPNQRILDFCGQHALRCLDLLPLFRSAYERDHRQLYFPVDRHLNAYGNRLAAAAVWDYLRGKGVFCNP
jgi:hypothetical protein